MIYSYVRIVAAVLITAFLFRVIAYDLTSPQHMERHSQVTRLRSARNERGLTEGRWTTRNRSHRRSRARCR